MTADDVLELARRHLHEFGDDEFVTDEELWEELGGMDRRLVEQIARANARYPIPELDGRDSASVAAVLGPWSTPADFWRMRYAEVEYTSGRRARIQLLPLELSTVMPAVTPAMVVDNGELIPIDGLYSSQAGDPDDRKWGWAGASEVHMNYLAEPTAPSSGASDLACPDDAKLALSYQLAAFLAPKAKLEEVHATILINRFRGAERLLLDAVEKYGNAG